MTSLLVPPGNALPSPHSHLLASRKEAPWPQEREGEKGRGRGQDQVIRRTSGPVRKQRHRQWDRNTVPAHAPLGAASLVPLRWAAAVRRPVPWAGPCRTGLTQRPPDLLRGLQSLWPRSRLWDAQTLREALAAHMLGPSSGRSAPEEGEQGPRFGQVPQAGSQGAAGPCSPGPGLTGSGRRSVGTGKERRQKAAVSGGPGPCAGDPAGTSLSITSGQSLPGPSALTKQSGEPLFPRLRMPPSSAEWEHREGAAG